MHQELNEVIGAEVPRLTRLQTLRHSTAHVMAAAVKRLFPEAKVTIGPAIATGFYYDFDVPRPFTDEDLVAIEGEMQTIVASNVAFERKAVSRDQARDLFAGLGEHYKVELLDAIPPDATITYYTSGDFLDLCKGPHVKSTGDIGAFKLLSVAGAYWRGNQKNPLLQRIYGTAFTTKKELDEHLHRLEDARRRDHRKLGKELDLFSVVGHGEGKVGSDETTGEGLLLWHPKGARLRYLVEQLWRDEHFEHGYQLVGSPHIARDPQVEPTSCRFHATIYKHAPRSHRDLPLRFAELGFTRDDAHLFMTREQLPGEVDRTLAFCLDVLRTFGFTDFKLTLATRPEKLVGESAIWDEAEGALEDALKKVGLPFERDPGGAAAQGPRIDLELRDAIGREWQCSSISVDFDLAERFDLTCVGQDGQKQRAVMLHRALFGSVERFIAALIEHCAGAFPLWLAPVQARVITVTAAQEAWAREVHEALVARGLRVDIDLSSDKLGAKVRTAQLEKIPLMLVCGDKEVAAGALAPRTREGKQMPAMPLAEFAQWMEHEAQIPRPTNASVRA